MKRFFWLIVLLSFVAGYLYWSLYGATPMLAPDSASYLTFSTSRAPGYPFFLAGFQWVFENYDAVPFVQLVLLIGSIAFLTLEFYKSSKSWFWSIALWLLLIGNIEIIKYAFLILTESLSMTILLSALALLCRYFSTDKIRYLFVYSALIGLAILVRPAAYGWVLGLVWAIPIVTRVADVRYDMAIVMFIAPLLLVLFAGAAYNQQTHGFFNTQSALGEMLIGKVGLLADKNIRTDQPEAMGYMAEYATPVRTFIDSAPNWRIRYLLTAAYSDQFRYSTFASRIVDKMNMSGQDPTLLDQARVNISKNIIHARFGAYLKSVLLNYIALWQVWDLPTPEEAKQMASFLTEHSPLPNDFEYPVYARQAPYKQGTWLAFPLRLALLWVFFVSIWALVRSFLRWREGLTVSKTLFLLAVTAGMVQGAFILTALVQSGIPRFFLVMWPGLVLLGVFSLWALIDNFYGTRERPFK